MVATSGTHSECPASPWKPISLSQHMSFLGRHVEAIHHIQGGLKVHFLPCAHPPPSPHDLKPAPWQDGPCLYAVELYHQGLQLGAVWKSQAQNSSQTQCLGREWRSLPALAVASWPREWWRGSDKAHLSAEVVLTCCPHWPSQLLSACLPIPPYSRPYVWPMCSEQL